MRATTPMEARRYSFGGESWEETRERLDAAWDPLWDEKHRRVHGYAVIGERPERLNGRELREDRSTRRFGHLRFEVYLIATRDGYGFGAISRRTYHETREQALAHAARALTAQGKRYARKYGRAK